MEGPPTPKIDKGVILSKAPHNEVGSTHTTSSDHLFRKAVLREEYVCFVKLVFNQEKNS